VNEEYERANKRMVLTLPARGNFRIIARHKRLGCSAGFILPLRARAGRTCEALNKAASRQLSCPQLFDSPSLYFSEGMSE
jgi:hypothetical protein